MPDKFRDYYHSMDREYHGEPLVPLREVGISKMITKDALQPLVAAIRSGASKVELGFMGQGKGSIFAGQLTPESVGEHERRAIKELAKVNDIEISTHATIGVNGVSGMDKQGNFSDKARAQTLNEIRRAIDFAADTTEGGAIVFHTSEFQKEIGHNYDGLFAEFPGQMETETVVQFVDTRSGRNLGGMKRSDPIMMPPKYNEEKKEWVVEKIDWEELKKRAKAKSEKEGKEIKPEQMMIDIYREQQLQQKEDRIRSIESSMDITESHLEAAKHRKEEEKIKRYTKELHKMQGVRKQAKQELEEERASWERGDIKPINNYAIEQSTTSIAEVGVYAFDRTKDAKLKKPLFVAPENLFPGSYGAHPKELKKLVLDARDKMAELMTKPQLEKTIPFGGEVRKKKIDNPFFHGDISKEKARKLADKHIKATFDIGHANLWRKYFKAKKGESREQTDKRFNKWLMNEVEELNKAGVIGHVHISDNFGWEDEHLTPGMGKVPITEFIKKMKESGGKLDLVVEPGAQDPTKQYQALFGGWRLFGHSIYGPEGHTPVSAEFLGAAPSYWGARESPRYLYGENVPSNEYRGSPFWTGLGLE